MLTVTVRFDRSIDGSVVRLDGYCRHYPAVGKSFVFFASEDDVNTYLDLGKIIHIRAYQKMLLVQTESMVAEVWIQNGTLGDWANVLPFASPIPTAKSKGGLRGPKRNRASSRPQSLTNFNSYN